MTAAERFIKRFNLPYEIDDANNATSEKYWWIYIPCDSNRTATKLAKAIDRLHITSYSDLTDSSMLNKFVVDKNENVVKMIDDKKY